MTFIIPGGDEEKAARENTAIWEKVTRACHDAGGSMSHHHGVGYWRGQWMDREWSQTGFDLMQRIKNVIDPNHIMNPGKAGLR
jgi:alkyldihydroxyacetonephosphate synthase